MEDTIIKLKDGNREIKVRIEKMDAFKAEDWYLRAMMLLGEKSEAVWNGANIQSIIAMISSVGYHKVKPLLDELLSCCYLIRDKTEVQLGEDMPGMFYSPLTITRLRVESAKANFGFFTDGDALRSLANSILGQTAEK